jgi:peptidoglycan/LPS O-acetylase OafA/YrhL
MELVSGGEQRVRGLAVSPGISLYLDIVRFCAAMAVFVGHASGQLFTGGLLWQVAPYQRSAAIVFFVLSGFVISLVLSSRERDLFTYARQRIARLYSVVIPALVLTIVCDAIGLMMNPDFYYKGPWGYPSDNQILRYVLSFFFLNHTWLAPDMSPGINGPFWSLCYEASYYTFIGLIFFSSGVFRVVSVVCLALVAGPSIVALLPVWGLGFLLHRYGTQHRMPRAAGLVAVVSGFGMLALTPLVRARFPTFPFGLAISNCEPGDYVDALAFALQLYGAMSWHDSLARALRPHTGVIRYLGSLTFALYLFHRPLIQLFAAIPLGMRTKAHPCSPTSLNTRRHPFRLADSFSR